MLLGTRAAPYEIRVLGPVEIARPGTTDAADRADGPGGPGGTGAPDDSDRVVVLGRPMQRTVLGLLALRRGRVVSQSALVDALWDDNPPRSAVKTLHSHVSHLRRALVVAGLGELVDTRLPGYLLTAPPDAVDAARFDRLVEAGRRQPAERAASTLRSALALWRGDALAGGTVGGWAMAEVARLGEARLYAAEELYAAELAVGRHAAVAVELEAFVAQHPLRERPWELLMLALHLGGRQGDALGAYRRARTVLMTELGISPGSVLRRLEASILAGDEPRRTHWLVPDPTPPTSSPHLGPATAAGMAAAGGVGVPAPVTTLVGRGKDIVELVGLLSQRRLVTLTGIGGCGKTRLAIAVAGELPAVVFVDLTEVTDPELVPAALGDALGERGDPTVEALARRLHRTPVLLVLDNCEHLVRACAALVETLLRRCPGLRVLATSREALAVPGETVWPVQPLSVPAGKAVGLDALRDYDAVRLFLDRAALPAVRGLTDADAPALAAICAGLDGLPLALELAAARTAVLTVTDIARRLRDPALLRDTSRTGRPHHRALDATIAWSHDALDDDARSRFRRLAVFSGGFTLAATAAVWQTDTDRALDALADLVSRSLVIVDRSAVGSGVVGRGVVGTRYRMLETIRHHGAERLAAAPAEESLARGLHARHHLALTVDCDARLRGADSAHWLATLAADHENLRSALAWFGRTGDPAELRMAVALARYCRLRGRYREGRRWLTDALSRTTAPAPATRIRMADPAPQDVATRRRVALDAGQDTPRGGVWPGGTAGAVAVDRAAALLAVAFLAHFEGAYALAESYAGQALEANRRLGDRSATARCLRLLGSIASERGEYDRSRAAYAEAMAAYAGLDDELGQADILQMTGFVAWLGGDLDGAEPLLQRALRRYGDLSDAENVSSTRVHLAAVALYRGDRARARWLADEALAHFTELGFKEGIAWALDIAGRAALGTGDVATASTSLRSALGVHHEVGDRWRQASVLDALAAAHLAADAPVRAAALCALATALRDELAVPVPLVERPDHARTHAALATRLTDDQRYAALTQAAALAVPDILTTPDRHP